MVLRQRALCGAPLLAILATAFLDGSHDGPQSADEVSCEDADAPRVQLLQLSTARHGQDAARQAELAGSPLFSRWEEASNVGLAALAAPPRRELPTCDLSDWTKACKPGFMVIGVQKAGTSSLYNILKLHPQIRPASQKELLFFNGDFGGVNCDWPRFNPRRHQFSKYLQSFPRLGPHSNAVTGEFSATYFHCYCCPAAFKRLMPNVRLVVQLRDPIERARSRYAEQQGFGRKWAQASFEDYVEKALPGLERCLRRGGKNYGRQLWCAGRWNVLGLSLYDAAMQAWLQSAKPGNLLVTYLDDLAAAPEAVVNAIHAHLGLENYTYALGLSTVYNKKDHYGWDAPSALQVSSRSTMQRLFDFYRPHMQALQELARDGSITKLPESWTRRWSL